MAILLVFFALIILSITHIVMYRKRHPLRAWVYRMIHLLIVTTISIDIYSDSGPLVASQVGLFYITAYCYFGKIYNKIRGRRSAEKFQVIRLFFFFLFIVVTSLALYFGTRAPEDLITPIIILVVIEQLFGRIVRSFAKSAKKRDDKYLARIRLENGETVPGQEVYQNPFQVNKQVQDALDLRYEESYTNQVKKTSRLLYKELPPFWESVNFMPIRLNGRRYQTVGGSPSGNILLFHFLDESGKKVTDPELATKLHNVFFYVNAAFLLCYGPFRQMEYLFRTWDSEKVKQLAPNLAAPTNNGHMEMGEMLVTLDTFLNEQQSLIQAVEPLKQKLASLSDELTEDQASVVRDAFLIVHERYLERITFLLTYRSDFMRLARESALLDDEIILPLEAFYKEALLYENNISDLTGSLVDTSEFTLLQPLAFDRNWLGKEKTESIHQLKSRMSRMKQLIWASIMAIPLYIAAWVWTMSDALYVLLLFFALIVTPVFLSATYAIIRANSVAKATLAYLDRIQTTWRKPVYYRGMIVSKSLRYIGPFVMGGSLVGIALAYQSFGGNFLAYLLPAMILLGLSAYFFFINPASLDASHLVVLHRCGLFYHNLDHPIQHVLQTVVNEQKQEIRIVYRFMDRPTEATVAVPSSESFDDVAKRAQAWAEDHGIPFNRV